MNDTDITALTTRVLWTVLALGLVFGVIARRTRFCTLGAISDVVAMDDWQRARMWALAVATAMLGFNIMVALGWVEARNSLYAGPRLLWLSALVGGALFGFGMSLASGCGSRNLVRLGGGNLKSLIVLLVLAVSASATLRGLTGVLRVETVERVGIDLPAGQDLPTLLAATTGLPVTTLAALIGGLLAFALLVWVLRQPEGRRGETWLGGLGIGAVIVAVWWVSGRLGYVPEDPNTLEPAFLATSSRRMESLSMVAPVAYAFEWLQFFSDKSRVLTLGIVAMFGVAAGALVHALATREFRWEGFANVEDLGQHLVGGALMGVGGVVALGCTVGQGISGVSTLSLGSFLAVGGIIAGTLLGLRWQRWRIERAA
ncbi:transporter [Hylemonella gracilis str. Niagara R]|uniref:Transporter n=1 Tax=Hylemonella gracilis str. Niagara R TaxID=1458275 RepID=A0A016XLE1_9BURK|nr:YeeE/YedE family protein [Hylemonella gracilis]EYC52636.1 transporter [Hylemonella gracilis str. Niagara R]